MRYIDADALYEKLYPLDLVDKRLYTINAKAVADAIAKTPTADVVPKSEVEALLKENARWLMEYANYRAEVNSIIEKAKREIAMEIFEEIEKLFLKDNFRLICNRSAFAELKKKYTEEKKNGNEN